MQIANFHVWGLPTLSFAAGLRQVLHLPKEIALVAEAIIASDRIGSAPDENAGTRDDQIASAQEMLDDDHEHGQDE